MSDRPMVCIRCGRVGTRGFVISSGTGDGRDTYRCANTAACERREKRAERDVFPPT